MEWVKSKADFIDMFENFLERIQRIVVPEKQNTIIFIGHMLAFDKGTCNYMIELRKRLENTYFFVLNESIGVSDEKAKRLIPFDYLTVPRTAASGQFDPNFELDVPEKIRNEISAKEYLRRAVDVLYSWHDTMGRGYAEWLIYYVYKYYLQLIESLQPVAVVYWNEFNVLHDIFEKICNEKSIKNIFWEHGSLPGTFALEIDGQMGESYPAVHSTAFNNLEISKNEFLEASEIVKKLRNEKANRNLQPKCDLKKALGNKIDANKPIILYTGQNDFESGIFPYTDHTKQFHSPIFKNSDEAAIYLSELAKKNNWNLVYKPHPLMLKYGKCFVADKNENVIIVDNVDLNDLIDYVDVVVTILSQCAYAALIREKPVVMLGYIQLRQKGCTYDAFDKNEIEKQIKNALMLGYTQEQTSNFIKHVAQLKKYYLFDNLLNKGIKYGKDIEAAAVFLGETISINVQSEKKLFVCNSMMDVYLFNCVCEGSNNKFDIIIDSGSLNDNVIKLLNGEKYEHFLGFDGLTLNKLVEYSEIYFSNLSLLKDNELTKNFEVCNIDIHILDNPNMSIYLTNVIDWLEKIPIRRRIRDLILISPQLFTLNTTIPIERLQPSVNVNILDIFVEDKICIREKYLYVEGEFFANKIFTNECELIGRLSSRVGIEKFAIICFSEDSLQFYRRKGYKVYLNCGGELECALWNTPRVIFSAYSSKYLSWILLLKGKNIYVSMHNFIIGKMNLRKTNTFKNFVKRCRELEITDSVFMPENDIELNEVLTYVAGGIDYE